MTVGAAERNWMIAIGALQGALLLAAHAMIKGHQWPATLPSVVVAWYAVVIGIPIAAELLLPARNGRRLLRYVLCLGLVLGGLGAYSGYVVGDGSTATSSTQAYFAFGLTAAIAWFIALPFAAIWIRTGSLRFPYSDLFAHAWGNTLTLGFGALFIGIFWALLGLWAALFGMIGVRFFAELFSKKEFIYPATTIAFGMAVYLGHTHAGAVATIRKVTLATYRGLLPLLASIALLFLLFLPFTGLQLLWNTRHAAALMLTTQVSLILFLNAAYQDGQGAAPYHHLVRQVVVLAVITLPVYSMLTLYALFLRVTQHGWTGARVWAVLLAVITTLYAIGYMVAAFARGNRWLGLMSPVNVAMALFVMMALVAANTPLLDPMRIGAASQVERLLSGKISAAQFDYRYLRFDAGRYGRESLERLAVQPGKGQDAGAIRKDAARMLAQEHRWSEPPAPENVADTLRLLPQGKAWDPGFIAFLQASYRSMDRSCSVERQCPMLATDLNGDGRDEYVEGVHPFRVFARDGKVWHAAGRMEQADDRYRDVRRLLDAGDYRAVAPSAWRNLRVGDGLYVFVESRGELKGAK